MQPQSPTHSRMKQTLIVFAFVKTPASVLAQTPEQESAEPPEKALKYHAALLRRPSPGYLFDRFFGAWLEASTAEQLEAFLRDRAAKEMPSSFTKALPVS